MSVLRTRLLFGSFMTALTVGLLWSELFGFPVRVWLVPLVAALAQWEFYAMAQSGGWPAQKKIGIAAGLIWTTSGLWWPWGELTASAFLTGVMLLLFVRAVLAQAVEGAPVRIGVTLLGILGIPFLLVYLAWMPWHWAVFCILVSKVGDSCAYFAGSAFGRHKLIPAVSPNKSWEGAVASLLGALLASWAFWSWNSTLSEHPLWIILLIGSVTNVGAQLGDLSESLLKRGCKVKDSAALIPVAGGMFDLVDSFLLAAPTLYFILTLFNIPS
ncbi:MAG: phosphatidate cytidylyltransferase [Planctomycetota bacterium]|nr:phosphatidate cytidylyltransferase [Planctomycetota bacterium]